MSKAEIINEYVLPPNIKGKCRGSLEIDIVEIHWNNHPTTATLSRQCGLRDSAGGNYLRKSPEQFIGSKGISIKFIWWGQSQSHAALIQVSGSSGKIKDKSVKYNILTNCKLFQNYLTNCEPIEIKLTANTSNLEIGTVFARIPSQLIASCSRDCEKPINRLETYKIFNRKNVHIGNIILRFKMILSNKLDSCRSSELSCDVLLAKQKAIPNLDLNGLNTGKSYKQFKSGKENSLGMLNRHEIPQENSSKSTVSSNIIDFLSGQNMTQQEENNALEEIRSTSPLGHIIEEIVTDRIKTKQSLLYSRIDSLRLEVKSLSLLPPGIREVCVDSLANVTFTVESRISPNLLDNIRPKYEYDIMRFYSDSYNDKTQRIDFNKEAIRSVRIIQDEFDPNIVEEANLMFTVWWREFGSKHSRCLGTSVFRFTSIFEAGELEQTKRISVKSCTGCFHVADLICKVTLCTRGVHFGPSSVFETEAIINTPRTEDEYSSCSSAVLTQNRSSEYLKIRQMKPTRKRNYDRDDRKSTHNSSSNSSANSAESNIEKSNQATQTVANANSSENKENGNFVDTVKQQDENQYRLLHGLLYIGSIRSVRAVNDGGYFLVCRAFWKEDATSTDFCQNNNFNFIEMFPIINDQKFLNRARNSHLNIELWLRGSETAEQMIGIVRLPLHQFFIAYRDSAITNHLCQSRLPVISVDGWVPITSPLSGEICGQLQSLLAIGTEEQLEYLKASRGLNFNMVCENAVPDLSDLHIPVPKVPKLPQTNADTLRSSSCDAESQTSFDEINSRRERLSDLLGTFIENLAQHLPADRVQDNSITDSNSGIITQSASSNVQIRKTSDLLDVLQKALVIPPVSTNLTYAAPKTITQQADLQEINPSRDQMCKILVEIECALHLPRNPMKIGSKKNSKRSGGSKGKQQRFPPNEEPSAYVTFQAEQGHGQIIKSHEGMVYATHVVEKCCNPIWGKRFEVAIPADLLTNDEKRFILKIWRKAATDLAQCRLLPTPMEDSVIGFAAVDLNVLLARMPCISGWFNIVDFNGRVNGQIKVNVQPLEDIMKFKDNYILKTISTTPAPVDAAPTCPIDLNNATLGRAIKRKFSELEEITQRLRARLFDVTGEAENEDNLNDLDNVEDQQLDEFERDINTTVQEEEDEDNIDGRNNFGWLGGTGLEAANDDNKLLFNSEYSSTISEGSQERIQLISECLKRTGLNEDDKEGVYNMEENNIKCSQNSTYRK